MPFADIAELDNLRDVLRIHDLRAARHGQHIIGQSRPHDRILPSSDGPSGLPGLCGIGAFPFGGDGGDDHAFGPPDHVIMHDQTVFGLRNAARHQLFGDLLALAVAELHLLPRLQSSTSHPSLLPSGFGAHLRRILVQCSVRTHIGQCIRHVLGQCFRRLRHRNTIPHDSI